MKEATLDTVYCGRLSLLQPKKGYRLSVDSLLLTAFACTGDKVHTGVDLGCGCGVVGLGLLLADHVDTIVGVELQPRLAGLAAENARNNRLSDRFRVIEGDVCALRETWGPARVALVVSNPPFWPAQGGRLPLDEERRVACHETHGDIVDWMRAAAQLLTPKRGRLAVVFPARRLGELFFALKAAHLSASRLRVVHPQSERPAELVLVEARCGEKGALAIEPPLVLKEADGTDTPMAKEILSGGFSPVLSALEDARLGGVPE